MTVATQEPQTTKGAAADTANPQVFAFLASKAVTYYPVAGLASSEYAARIVAVRFAVPAVIARAIVALNGVGDRP
jgi:hypothetical protein